MTEDTKIENDPGLPAAVELLCKELRRDPGYWESWKANIAMAFKDEVARHRSRTLNNMSSPLYVEPDPIHTIANNAAQYFLENLTREKPGG